MMVWINIGCRNHHINEQFDKILVGKTIAL
jgi:hypothetical protein